MLPEFWYAKITKDNIDLLQKWRKDKFNLHYDISNFTYINSDGGIGISACVSSFYVFITDDILLTHVLNDYVEKPIIDQDYTYLINFLI